MLGTIRMHQEQHYPGRVSATTLTQPRLRRLRGRLRRPRRARRAHGRLRAGLRARAGLGLPAILHCIVAAGGPHAGAHARRDRAGRPRGAGAALRKKAPPGLDRCCKYPFPFLHPGDIRCPPPKPASTGTTRCCSTSSSPTRSAWCGTPPPPTARSASCRACSRPSATTRPTRRSSARWASSACSARPSPSSTAARASTTSATA